jgi:hypothetical protein
MVSAFLGKNLTDEWLAAIGIDAKQARRVVIDIRVDAPVMIYVEQYASRKMLEVTPPDLRGATIKVLE